VQAELNLIDRVKGLFGISFGGPGASSYVSAQEWALGLPVTGTAGIEYPYAQHPTVSIAISTIAEDAASVDRELYPEGERDEDSEIEDHPLLDLWDKPNSTMCGADLWVASYTFFKLTGECIWYYPGLRVGVTGGFQANRRSTGEINLLDPTSVTVAVKNGELIYKQRVNGVDVPLDLKYLTHFKRFNPYNPLRGLSQLEALALELNVDWNAANWNKGYFGEHNGVPTGMILSPVGTIKPTQTDREEYLKQFNSYHAKTRRVGILPPGYSWQEIGSQPKDMEFGVQREFSREQILAVFGVPPFMAGVLDKANYANAREQSANYWNGPITRMLSYFSNVINYDFMPKVGVEGVEVWPDFERVRALVEDLGQKLTIAQQFFAMGFTKRMINDRLDLGMEVDELSDADVGYLPIGILPVDMVEEAHTPVGPTQPQDTPTNGDQNAPAKGFLRGAVQMSEGRRANVWRSISARTRDIEARFEKAIRKHFREIETEVLAQMNALKGWNLVNGVEKAETSSLFDIQFAKGKLMRLTLPLYTAAMDRGGVSVMSEVGASNPFDTLAPNVSIRLAKLTQKIKGIDDTVEKLLRESLVEGLKAGEGVSQLIKRIEAVMDASRSRAATIARTETGKAFTSGRVEGARQAGISKMEWLTAHDEFVRETHRECDTKVRALDEAFPNGLLYPCDPEGAPGETINCRCTVVPVVGEPNAA
jgi:HK97 family phage portal protein